MKAKKPTQREYVARVVMKVKTETISEGKQVVKDTLEGLGLKVTSVEKGITDPQMRSLHLWFQQLADALNAAGYDMRKTIRQEFKIPWTKENIKEYLWRPLMIDVVKKRSVTKLDSTGEIDLVKELIDAEIYARTKVHVPFPCEQLYIDKQINNQKK